MNTLTANGVAHDFATVAELLALPAVKRYVDDPAVSSFGYNETVILAAVGNPPVWHEVGRVKERVVLPRSLGPSQGIKP